MGRGDDFYFFGRALWGGIGFFFLSRITRGKKAREKKSSRKSKVRKLEKSEENASVLSYSRIMRVKKSSSVYDNCE